MKQCNDIESFGIYYIIQYQDEIGNLKTEELVENGSNIHVTDYNDYFEKRIEYMIKKLKPFVEEITNGLYKVFKSYLDYT
jgi:hypothetical protein